MKFSYAFQGLWQLKLWQRVLVLPLLAFAVCYWFLLLGVFALLSWPAIKMFGLLPQPTVPKVVVPAQNQDIN